MKKMMAGIVALMILVCGCAAFAERTLLTEQDAMEAALAHVRLTKEEVTFNRVHMGWDDGRQVWEIVFTSGNIRYEMEIDAVTGQVRDFDTDRVSTWGWDDDDDHDGDWDDWFDFD